MLLIHHLLSILAYDYFTKTVATKITEYGCQDTKSSKSVPQIILVNEAISVLVHDGEGLRSEHTKRYINDFLK